MSCNHLTIDARSCEYAFSALDEQVVMELFNACIERVGLRAACPIRFAAFSPLEGDTEHAEGLTAVQILTTSHISLHSQLEDGGFYFDLFSCVPFDPEVVMHEVQAVFGRGKYRMQCLSR